MSDYFVGSEWANAYAKRALPVLINFAESGRPTTYTELAIILLGQEKYAHPLMSALGRLGYALEALSDAKLKKFDNIPPIQLLVCNQKTRRPGNLALNFLGFKKTETDRMSKQKLDSLVLAAHHKIFAYERWHDVLTALDLKPVTLKLPAHENVLSEIRRNERRASGEGEEHEKLKSFLAQNPKKIGIQWEDRGDTEKFLLSGDRLDISFRGERTWIAVEVKPKQAPTSDLIRGIFQCVKYRAVLAAQLRYESLEGSHYVPANGQRVILACGAFLSKELRALADSLNVEVREGIEVPQGFVA